MNAEDIELVKKRLDESLRQARLHGIPRKPKPKPEPKDAEVFSLNPWARKRVGRKWRAHPDTGTSALPYEPTYQDQLRELQLANAAVARKARADASSDMGLYGDDTIDDLVRRQDNRWRD